MTKSGLASVEHIVVLMLENRSFDMMLGFLYDDRNNVSLAGQPYEGLTGKESNTDASGKKVGVHKIKAKAKYAYYMPGADPGEHFQDANIQLFGADPPPEGASADCSGFLVNFKSAIAYDKQQKRKVLSGTVPSDIMSVFPKEMLPVLSGLARGYAVCDHWFASVPTETMPNRSFACAATSQGHMDDATFSVTVPSVFGLLSKHNVSWAIYGYTSPPLTRSDFPDTLSAPDSNFGLFTDFQKAASAGKLPSYTFLEPEWSPTGNSQHPNYNVALGEQLIHDVYYALRNGPGWNQTLLIVTYDEHGGCYDHVSPPTGAVPPDVTPGEFGFDFTRSPSCARRCARARTAIGSTGHLRQVHVLADPHLHGPHRALPALPGLSRDVRSASPRLDRPLPSLTTWAYRSIPTGEHVRTP